VASEPALVAFGRGSTEQALKQWMGQELKYLSTLPASTEKRLGKVIACVDNIHYPY